MNQSLPPIPAKRYFTIGEVGRLCDVKPHVLRYWEREFTQLRPMKRRGNRRYYQHHEVLMIRRIRELLYEQGYSINGARKELQRHHTAARAEERRASDLEDMLSGGDTEWMDTMRDELENIRDLLTPDSAPNDSDSA